MNVVVRETGPPCFAHFILPVCFIMKGECMMIMDDNIVLYDREAAVEYARTYALVYNKDYPNFDSGTPNSGDCMNFVSQCIHAGGMPQKSTVIFGIVTRRNTAVHGAVLTVSEII